MKTVFTIFIILFSSQLLAQVSGKSKPGKLFFKKSKVEEVKNPIINVVEPNLDNGKFNTLQPSITIIGTIEDEYEIEKITINNIPITLVSGNKFYYNVSLELGVNNILIDATNIKGGKSSKSFKIIYNEEEIALPKIVITKPLLNSDNEYVTEEDKIIIEGIIENHKNVTNASINNNPLTISSHGNFQFPLSLTNKLNRVEIKVSTNEKDKIDRIFNIIQNKTNSFPIITIIEPKVPANNQINHNESIITIRGKVEDHNAIRNIDINGQSAALLGKSEFFSNINLNDGLNNIVVKVTNVKGNSSEKVFRIITPVDVVGPEIAIIEPSVSRGLKIVRKKDVLKIRGKVNDRSGIINVLVNNREVKLMPNNEFTAQLYLGMGDNTIIVKATDRKYNVSTDTFHVTRKLEEVIKTGKYIALIIGINSYQGYWHPLSNAVNDARGFAQILKRDYYFDEIYTLIDKEATRKNIIQKFEWIINNSTRDDNILIFYAGHGQFKRSLNKGYWVPVDASSNSTADYISNNDIKTFIGGIPSKHTLLITDACFAGDIFRGGRTESIAFDPSDMTRYYREVYSKPSRLALTSGSLEQVADAGKENHSIFTYYLLKSLQDNTKKYLDASQLFNDFRMAVTNNSDQTPQLQVVRDTNDEGGQFIFIKKD